MSENKNVFISFRSEDTFAEVQHLKALISPLLDSTNRVFCSADSAYQTTSIEPGERWPEEIRNNLSKSRVMIVAIGDKWCDSFSQTEIKGEPDSRTDWVVEEIKYALEAGEESCFIIPILFLKNALKIDWARVPEPVSDLEYIQGLRGIKFYDQLDGGSNLTNEARRGILCKKVMDKLENELDYRDVGLKQAKETLNALQRFDREQAKGKIEDQLSATYPNQRPLAILKYWNDYGIEFTDDVKRWTKEFWKARKRQDLAMEKVIDYSSVGLETYLLQQLPEDMAANPATLQEAWQAYLAYTQDDAVIINISEYGDSISRKQIRLLEEVSRAVCMEQEGAPPVVILLGKEPVAQGSWHGVLHKIGMMDRGRTTAWCHCIKEFKRQLAVWTKELEKGPLQEVGDSGFIRRFDECLRRAIDGSRRCPGFAGLEGYVVNAYIQAKQPIGEP